MDAFGWRFTSVLTGIGVAVVAASIAQVLFGRALWTFATGLLIAVDGLNVVHSRIALLDVHVAFWVALGFLFLALDRRWIDRRTPPEPSHRPSRPPAETDAAVGDRVPSPFFRPWRFAAGAALGAAAAVKWSGAMAIPAAVLLTYIWETTRRHRGTTSRARAFVGALALESFGVVVAFALVPLAVYALTWIPWFVHYDPSVSAWIDQHRDMWAITGTCEPPRSTRTPTRTRRRVYYSKAWTWIPMLRPVSYFVEDLGPDIRQILAIGNPVLFWGTMWTIPYCAWAWWRKRDWIPGFIVVAFAGLYLPWFLVARPQFFFYALPLTLHGPRRGVHDARPGGGTS